MKPTKILLLSSASALVAGAARGSVVYSGPIDDVLTGTNAFQLDLNNDGTDFNIRFDGGGSGGSVNKPFVDARISQGLSGTGFVLGGLGADTNGVPVTPAGTAIGAAYASSFPGENTGYLYQDYNNNTVGNWSDTSVTDGYVGLELVNGIADSYGWVQLIFNPTAATPSLTVVDYAYETSPNTDIITGVPEPTTLALAGVGAAALLLRKRKK
jgi:hypothetical protein